MDLKTLYREHVAHLTAETHAVLEATGYDALCIHSGSLLKRSAFDDQYWPLRPVPHFQHWADLPWPDAVIHASSTGVPRLLYLRDKSFWERPSEPDWDHLGAALELVALSSADALKSEKSGRTAFIGEDLKRAADWGFAAEDVNPAKVLEGLDEVRVFKTPYEIACLAEANRIAARGHTRVAEAFRAGERSELELHLLFLAATAQDDPETPYKNIVALGENASILHHIHYKRAPRGGTMQSLLLDAGATCRGYASDVTRTHSSGSGAFADLVAGMEALQQEVCRRVEVGKKYEALHDEAHELLAGVLRDAGVLRMNTEEAVKAGVTRKFLPHGLGHSLGLQCHDVGCAKIKPRPDNPFLRNTRVIEPGQVFTIEPGVYFIDTFMEELRASPEANAIDWQAVEALSAFGGIRIEDDVVVRVPQIENLTRAVL